MTTNNPPHILAHLEIGFRTGPRHLQESEQELAAALNRARDFGSKHGSRDEWDTLWRQQWDNVESVLRRIRVLLIDMDGSLSRVDSERIKNALEAWETFLSEDARLAETLAAIREQASGLSAGVRTDWNLHARSLDPHLQTILAYAQALRVKLEWLKKHPKEAVDQAVQEIHSTLPNRVRDKLYANLYEQEYRKAAIELQQEQHKFLGFTDVVKALSMWVETPEERMRKNRSLQVDEAEACELAAQPQ